MSDLLLSPAWTDGRTRLAVTGVRCDWTLSQAGALAATIPARDALDAGLWDRIGDWVRFEHGSGAVWAGKLTTLTPRVGLWEIGALSFHAELQGRRTEPRAIPLVGTPGGLFRRLLSDTAATNPLPFRAITADQGGSPVTLDARAMDVYRDAIPALLEGTDADWDVDADRNVSFGNVGSDLTGSVHLCEGREVIDFDLPRDLWTIVNDWLVVAGDGRDFRTATRLVVEDSDSIRAYGRVQDTLVVPETSESSIRTTGLRQVARTKDPSLSMGLTLGNVDGITFGAFEVGDTVRVTLTSAGMSVAYRVRSMALDDDAGQIVTDGTIRSVIVGGS